MKRILFVDDEPRILQGLERMLHGERCRWEMVFAPGAEAALAVLGREAFDIVVSDVRMPGMDGVTLLGIVRERFPGTVRLVLSGYFEVGAAVRASPVAHQFLVKPCEADKLRGAIERACSLSMILADEATRRLVAEVGEMPCLPRTYARLVQALDKPDVPLKEVAHIIEQDVGVSAKVLQLANSAFFGLAREVATVQAAVGYLGLDVLRQLVLSVEVFRAFDSAGGVGGMSLDDMQAHSQLAAAIAGRLPVPASLSATASIAALLHDVGKLVMATRLRPAFDAAIARACAERRPLYVLEQETIGASHAEIGAYLLGLWGLPANVVEAVLHHHHPSRAEGSEREFGPIAAVHIANSLASEFGPASHRHAAPPDLDLAYIDGLGMADRLEGWREAARKIVREFVWV